MWESGTRRHDYAKYMKDRHGCHELGCQIGRTCSRHCLQPNWMLAPSLHLANLDTSQCTSLLLTPCMQYAASAGTVLPQTAMMGCYMS